jgi:hypothetical protein
MGLIKNLGACQFRLTTLHKRVPLIIFPTKQTSSPMPPLNTTTFIKPKNEEKDEAPLEDPRVRRNRLARKRHVTPFEEQRATNAN